MLRCWTTYALAVTLLTLSAAPIQAQDPAAQLPKAEDVLEAYVKAVGGRDAIAKHETLITVLKGKVVEQGMAITIETKFKRPGKVLLHSAIKGVFEQHRGFDGKVAWSKDPFMGERELKGSERSETIRAANMVADVDWKKNYKSVKTTGMEKVDGRDCVVVVLTPKEGHPLTNYYDAETHLLVKGKAKTESPMGVQSAETWVSEYKEAGGVKMPHKMKIKSGPMTMEMVIDKVTWDAPIKDEVFRMPGAKKAAKPDGGEPDGGKQAAPAATGARDQLAAFIKEQKIDKGLSIWKSSLPMPPKATFAEGEKYFWNLKTNKGDIKIRLMSDVAPMHVSSTIYLTDLGFYDDVVFHRVISGFMAQGGDPTGSGRGGPGYKYAGEFSPKVRHDRPGLLSMANAGPGTDGSQFFITFVPTPHLNDRHTIFGEVVSGMDAVKALEKCGSRRGQTTERLVIEKATISVN